MRYGFLFRLLILSIPIYVSAEAPKDEPPKPSVFVSFERQTIRESDSLQVEMRVSNDWKADLKGMVLHIAAPDFLEWHDNSCSGPIIDQQLDLGPIRASSVLTRKLCVRTEPEIKVGNFNILFTFEYTWETDGISRRSFVVSEKTLGANLFGSDNVGGVPLSLAGFIVPGLFFWIVLSHLKVPMSVGLALGEKMIYSVLVSIGIVIIGDWLRLTDMSGGIGITKLARLACAGIALGLLVSVIYYASRALWRRKKRATQMDANDALEVLLEKLLKQNSRMPRTVQVLKALLKRNSNRRRIVWLLNKILSLIPRCEYPRTTVHLRDGGVYVGSLSGSGEGAIWLAGWFQISSEGKSNEVLGQLNEYAENGNLIKIVRYARKNNLDIDTRTFIRQRSNGELEGTNVRMQNWKKEDVVRVAPPEEDENLGRVLEIV